MLFTPFTDDECALTSFTDDVYDLTPCTDDECAFTPFTDNECALTPFAEDDFDMELGSFIISEVAANHQTHPGDNPGANRWFLQ